MEEGGRQGAEAAPRLAKDETRPSRRFAAQLMRDGQTAPHRVPSSPILSLSLDLHPSLTSAPIALQLVLPSPSSLFDPRRRRPRNCLLPLRPTRHSGSLLPSSIPCLTAATTTLT